MLKSRIIILLVCFTCSCLLVVYLTVITGWMASHANGFVRKLPSHKLVGFGFMKLFNQNHYFAGGDEKHVYLGNKFNRGKVLRINIPGKDSTVLKINGVDTVKFTQGVYLRTDSTNLYLVDGNKPVIFSGQTSNASVNQLHPSPYFTGFVPISEKSYALRIVEKGEQNALTKLNNKKISTPYLLEKQGDGIFSTDGTLLKTPSSSMIFYIYFYRNQFLALDTNLQLLYKGKTIDTVNHAHIKVARISATHEFTMAAPPLLVNKQCAANDRWLFIHSGLKADNESETPMDRLAAIDVYSCNDGKYAFSFYIEDFAHEKMKDFRVNGNTLVALYDHYLYFYKLNF